jgi:phosphohistidine phosphatase
LIIFINPEHWCGVVTRLEHETAKMFKERLNIPDNDFEVKEDLYTFNQNELLTFIQTCPNDRDKLMVFGHNPALTILVNSLGDKHIDNLPTTGLCVIDFPVNDWKEIENGKTILTLFPKNLR